MYLIVPFINNKIVKSNIMITIHPQYITDIKGKKISVVLPKGF